MQEITLKPTLTVQQYVGRYEMALQQNEIDVAKIIGVVQKEWGLLRCFYGDSMLMNVKLMNVNVLHGIFWIDTIRQISLGYQRGKQRPILSHSLFIKFQ